MFRPTFTTLSTDKNPPGLPSRTPLNSNDAGDQHFYPGQWHSWTSQGPATGGASHDRQRVHIPHILDMDGKGGVGVNPSGATHAGHYSSSAPSPSPVGAIPRLTPDGLPLVGFSAGQPVGGPNSAATRPSTPDIKRYHPEPALAVLFDRYGGVDNALEVLLRATAQNGNDPVMWSDLGNAYRVKGDSDRAIGCFESALRLQPHPDFFLNLGGVRFVLGEVEEAIRLFTLGLQMNPRHVLLQFSMGNAYAMLGRKEEAARSFEATLRIQPDFAAADQYLRALRQEMHQQWWPNTWTITASVFFLGLCAIVQQIVQYYAMGGRAGLDAAAGSANGHSGRGKGGVDVWGTGGGRGGGSGGGNNAADPSGHASTGGAKQRRKGRHN